MEVIEIKENETEDTTFEEDDDIADYALSFMDFDQKGGEDNEEQIYQLLYETLQEVIMKE